MNDGRRMRCLTVADLWKCQRSFPFRFVSAQLFQSPLKNFLPFLFYFEMKPQSFTGNRTLKCDELISSSEYEKSFWKVRIDRVNGKEHIEELAKKERTYTVLIEAATDRLIRVIEKNSRSRVLFMRIVFAVSNGNLYH